MAREPPDLVRMDNDSIIDSNMEEYTFQDKSSGNVSWALKKGRSVGKKILVTSFVFSSAPVVLPPLVVISAFGFAVSIPYGIFLASFACTEKLMSVLLPNPSEYEPETDEVVYLDEMVEQNGYEEDVDEDELVMEGRKFDDEEEKIDTEVTAIVFKENGDQDRVGDIGDHEELLKETKSWVEKIKDEGTAADDNMIPEANGNLFHEGLLIRSPLGEDMNNDGEVIQEELEIATKVIEPIGAGDTIRVGNGIRVPSDSVEVSSEDIDYRKPAHSENLIVDRKDDDDMNELQNGKEVSVNSHENGKEIADERNKYYKDDEGVDSLISSKAKDSKEGELSSVVVVIDVTESAEDSSVSAVAIESKVEENAADKELEVYTEEKIRGEIESVRKIIGYKAAPHETCRDELTALYTFVGVEPPSSLTDPSDPNEVHQKLQFLMSVVGVK